MTAQSAVSGAVQIVGGVALSPLLIGLTQQAKARLQGRRGPGPLQPYRELRRLWGKSGVDVEGTTVVYRLAPVLVAAVMGAAVLLALARLAVCVAAWDTSNGFALQGASRDLTLSVFVEAALVLSLAVAALVAGTTDLPGIVGGTAGGHPWTAPALGLGAVAFALVVVAETGRQPVDNPDTHLELTMIHEGAALEFAGRDQALLQWAVAARHWIVLVIAAGIFLPHPTGAFRQLALLPVSLGLLCLVLAVTETLIAKMRILLVPRLIAVGAAVALLGIVTWLVDAL